MKAISCIRNGLVFSLSFLLSLLPFGVFLSFMVIKATVFWEGKGDSNAVEQVFCSVSDAFIAWPGMLLFGLTLAWMTMLVLRRWPLKKLLTRTGRAPIIIACCIALYLLIGLRVVLENQDAGLVLLAVLAILMGLAFVTRWASSIVSPKWRVFLRAIATSLCAIALFFGASIFFLLSSSDTRRSTYSENACIPGCMLDTQNASSMASWPCAH